MYDWLFCKWRVPLGRRYSRSLRPRGHGWQTSIVQKLTDDPDLYL